MTICNGCSRDLDKSFFYIRKDGSTYPICKECCKRYSSNSYKKHKDKHSIRGKKYRIENPFKRWATSTINHHKKRNNCTFNFSISELENIAKFTTHCPICGSPLYYIGKYPHRNTPTLDRIYGDKELTLDNINIICYTCNSAKGVMTYNELIKYCKDVIKISGDTHGSCH